MILLPVETTAREIESRIIIAMDASPSHAVKIIANQVYVRKIIKYLGKSVYVGKHLFGKPAFADRKTYDRLKRQGSNVVYLHEEGGIWPGQEPDWLSIQRRMERPEIFEKDDYHCVWGQWQYDHYHSKGLACNLMLTGHPKFASYKEEKYRALFSPAAKAIVDEYGSYILINTAFPAYNHLKDPLYWFEDAFSWKKGDHEARKSWMSRFAIQGRAFLQMIELILELSARYPEKKMIIRPHPSEQLEAYESIFRDFPNVLVRYKGSAVPWMLGADCLIHHNCTTGFEADLLGKTVINFLPDGSQSGPGVRVAGESGHICQSAGEVIDILDSEGGAPASKYSAISKSLCANVEGIDSIELLGSAIHASMEGKDGVSQVRLRVALLAADVEYFLHNLARSIYLRLTFRSSWLADHKRRFTRLDTRTNLRMLSDLAAQSGRQTKLLSKRRWRLIIK